MNGDDNKNNKIYNNSKAIAEAGLSHDGSLGIAKAIDKAKENGADAIKFQMHIPELSHQNSKNLKNFHQDRSRFDYWKRTFTFNDGIFEKLFWKRKNFLCVLLFQWKRRLFIKT